MDNTTQKITNAIYSLIQEYITQLSDKLNIDKKTLEQIFNDMNTDLNINTRTCPYMFIKGKKQGQICGAKSKNGNKYCSKHKSKEDKNENSKNVAFSSKSESSKLIMKKHPKFDVWYHTSSKFVFNNEQETIVIGKIVDGEIVDINKSDVKKCKQYGFKYQLKDYYENLDKTVTSILDD